VKSIGLKFPHYAILKASAGSGKTTALTKRYVYFLLSPEIPHRGLRKILAITFSNNAAYEMKNRILRWLKDLYFKETKTLEDFSELIPFDEKQISNLAETIIEEIINNYSDFQVKTIDSFMTSIFKASAVDFDYNPDFEILMKNDFLMTFAYDLFLKDIDENTRKKEILIDTLETISPLRKSFIWNPAQDILNKIKELYSVLSKTNKEFDNGPSAGEIERTKEELIEIMRKIVAEVSKSGFERNSRNQIFDLFEEIIRTENFKEIISRGISTLPVKKPRNKNLINHFERIEFLWNEFQNIVSRYAYLYGATFYASYLDLFKDFNEYLKKIKRKEGKIFIEDLNKMLSEYLKESIVTDIYFRLGERIHHYLIDEFQDTSPLQWANLKPLIENALSEGGSLFVVGDTKQAIYSFRAADYRIMRELERKHTFPSSVKEVEELKINYRSKGKIVCFVDEFFKEKIRIKDIYISAASLTGISSYEQKVPPEAENDGYVEIKAIYEDMEDINGAIKDSLYQIISDARTRGFNFRDMAILAFKNEQIVNLSVLLNELNYPFVSYSSLDVRKRKITAEIFSLLKFLDSPLDDFSFSVFLLGDLYKTFLIKQESLEEERFYKEMESFMINSRESEPLYKSFQREFSNRWERDFKELFKLTGYLPLYDLITVVLSNFRVFEIMPEEEATFLKILEIAKVFEKNGSSSIKDFIEFINTSSNDERIWDISLGSEVDAINAMTIHKAKGLGFPLVIVFLEDIKALAEDYILYENENNIQIFKITNDLADKSEFLKTIKESDKISKMADFLNTLYVAFTRAREELYIICKVKKETNFPFDILREFFGQNFGFKKNKERSEIFQIGSINTEHYNLKINFPVKPQFVHFSEKQRGEIIHKLLSKIEYIDIESPHETISQAEKYLKRINKALPLQEIEEIIYRIINDGDIVKFFIPREHRRIFNEFDIADERGFLHRIDRLVVDKDKVTLIEYKTGNPAEEHIEQARLYLELISRVFENVNSEGFLYYLDSGDIKWISF
jgi:ATP-dependent exoDNAse (exonuclease V) beta subunit